jgi:hypothetical protein
MTVGTINFDSYLGEYINLNEYPVIELTIAEILRHHQDCKQGTFT